MTGDVSGAIDAALASGDVAGAVRLSRAALAAGNRDPFVRNLVAWQLVVDGEAAAGERCVREGLVEHGDDPHLLTTLGLALRRQQRLSEALLAFDAAIAAEPSYAVAWLERGFTLHEGSSFDLAAASYRRAASLDPSRAQAWAGTASIAAMQGDYGVARDLAMRALAIDPTDAVARCALARCDIAEDAPDRAAQSLRAMLATPGIDAEHRSAAASLFGDALARLGEPTAAIAAYADAKSGLAARFPHVAVREPHRQLVERIDRHIMASGEGTWAPPPADRGRRHGFLLGYPRSGTTLVETIIASIDGVATLEELPTLLAAEVAFFETPGGLDRLDTADADRVAQFRRAYWQRVADFGVGGGSEFVLDMDPIKSVALPLIGRLFPAAPIVVMRRDPRDVVLSCFRQNFAPSQMALALTTLEDCARHYDAVMRLQTDCLARLPNPVLALCYENLIADFDTTSQQLCAFLQLPWTTALRNFSQTARRLTINTASVAQVRRGLFNGAGQWRHFATEMAPILPILTPWTRDFGYPDG